MLKHDFLEALKVNKSPKTTLCTLCKYVDDKRQHRNEVFEYPQTNNIPSLHIFFSKHLLDMENIEDRIKSMILKIDLKKRLIIIIKILTRENSLFRKEKYCIGK